MLMLIGGCLSKEGVAMQVRIVVYRNEKKRCVPITESGAGIGRDAGNPVQLSSPEVSKRHAFLHRRSTFKHGRGSLSVES
jgi:hypothetical protein